MPNLTEQLHSFASIEVGIAMKLFVSSCDVLMSLRSQFEARQCKMLSVPSFVIFLFYSKSNISVTQFSPICISKK